jgi:hypothetical protein
LHEEVDWICPVMGPDISGNLLWNPAKRPDMHGWLEIREAQTCPGWGPDMSGKPYWNPVSRPDMSGSFY